MALVQTIQQNVVGKAPLRALLAMLQMEITLAATEPSAIGLQQMQSVQTIKKEISLGAFQRLLKCLIGLLIQKAREIMV